MPLLNEATDIEFVASQEEISAFGGGIVAVSLEINGSSQIRFLDLDSRKVLAFPSALSSVSFANFSHDGQFLTYEGKVDSIEQIFISRWDGFSPKQVTLGTSRYGNPSWTNDDAGLLFYSELALGQRELATATFSDGVASEVTLLTGFGSRSTTPVQSATSSQIAYSTDKFFPGWDICFLNPKTRISKCPLGSQTQTYCRPRWSPSGQQIVLSKGSGDAIDLYSFTLGDTLPVQLTSLAFKEYDAEFSPDGKVIAFAHEAKGDERYDLWLLRKSDKALLLLARSKGSIRYPSWSFSREYGIATAELCPTASIKITPGLCGCDVTDLDSDTDSIPDCKDLCPNDPAKTSAGLCGCGQLEPLQLPASVADCVNASPPEAKVVPDAPQVRVRQIGPEKYQVTVLAQNVYSPPFTFVLQRGKHLVYSTRNKANRRFVVTKGNTVRFAYKGENTELSSWTARWRVGSKKH